jgi:glycosyltransferase involved in cell wall biosynthesis
MKVMFISRRFYPDVLGGGEISAFYIARAVKKQGKNVVVCTFTNKKLKIEIMDGIKVYRIPIPKIKLSRLSNLDYMYFQMAKLASKFIEKEKPQILHLLNFESVPFSAIYYKKKFKIPIVATVNGPLFGCYTGLSIDYKKEVCTNCRVFKRYFCSVDKWGYLQGMF